MCFRFPTIRGTGRFPARGAVQIFLNKEQNFMAKDARRRLRQCVPGNRREE